MMLKDHQNYLYSSSTYKS